MINITEKFLLRFTRPSRLYASDGTTFKELRHEQYSYQGTPANGDRLQTFFICDGTETKLELSKTKGPSSCIWDLYINNVLDSNGYDDYAAANIEFQWEITLTQKIKKGLNTIEFRVNGKNASSVNYYCAVTGASLQ